MALENERQPQTAVLCLTLTGSQLGLNLAASLGDCVVYIPRRLAAELRANQTVKFFDAWNTAFGEVWATHSKIICIMAAGIVVRSLASRLKSKYQDPAVVVMDENGQYAISMLSGHIGGGNELAIEAARCTGGQAVITTATDVQGQMAADLLALDIEAIIDPTDNLKIINRNLAENQPVYLYSPWPLVPAIKKGFIWREWPGDGRFVQPAVIIGHIGQHPSREEILWLKPRNLTVGLGCRQGVSCDELRIALDQVLARYDLDPRCIRNLASIELKADEPGLRHLAKNMGIPLLTFSRAAIQMLAGTYQESDWVKQITGVGGVCEPAARLASRQGITLVPKQKIGPVAISVAMEKSWWWDWAPETLST